MLSKKSIVVLLILAVCGYGLNAAVQRVRAYLKERNRPHYQEAKVERGDIVSVINSTGTVQPVLRVQVGTFVSGPIAELLVDFNDRVKKGQILARIDPRIYKAAVARDKASLATAKANVAKVTALLEQAREDERRASELRAINEEYLADTMMDQYKYNRISLEADLEVALASVEQAKANLSNSETNLGYTDIISPYDGIVIDRKIDEGQTLAAQFNTPELFIVAPDMGKEMYVYASVDEADIGYIREAERREQPVEFTVDAYPEDIFKGTVHQIRMNPTTVQNVVTYPVIVKSPNPDLKLMPGMTATISFQTEQCKDVIKIPNAALRFYPKPEQVRPEDKKVLEGETKKYDTDKDEGDEVIEKRSASDVAEAGRQRHRRHVWIKEGELLRATEITIGTNDGKFSELKEGDLKPGQKLVTGVESK